jgi:hypothetical protein
MQRVDEVDQVASKCGLLGRARRGAIAATAPAAI